MGCGMIGGSLWEPQDLRPVVVVGTGSIVPAHASHRKRAEGLADRVSSDIKSGRACVRASAFDEEGAIHGQLKTRHERIRLRRQADHR